MNKKLSWATIIIIVILSVCVGIGGGILLSKKMENSKIVKDAESKGTKTQEEKTIEPEKETQTTKEETKYDGEKSITIDGKTYVVSWIENIIKNASEYESGKIELKLYLDNKKIKSLWFDIYDEIQGVKGNYQIKIHNVSGYIVVEIEEYTPGKSHFEFFVFNTKGEHIDTLSWDDSVGIQEIATGKRLSFEINSEYIIIYDPIYNKEGAYKYKYTFEKDMMFKEIDREYYQNEVILSGK